MLLTDEEIVVALLSPKDEGAEYFSQDIAIEDCERAIAKAQLKKVGDRLNHWYKELCPHTNRGSFKYGCIECWQSLLEEVE